MSDRSPIDPSWTPTTLEELNAWIAERNGITTDASPFHGYPPIALTEPPPASKPSWPWPEATADGFLVPPGFGEELRDALEAMVLSRLATGGGVFVTREHKPVPRRTRLRWWRARQRENLASLAYRLIAGRDLPGGDE